jgi:hypothetical protein
MSTTLPTHQVLAEDGTLAYQENESSSPSNDSSSPVDSIAALVRTRFHNGSIICVSAALLDLCNLEMEELMYNYKITVLGEGKERIDGQLVYRVDCPLHLSENTESPLMSLDLWCFEETLDTFSLGYRIESAEVLSRCVRMCGLIFLISLQSLRRPTLTAL